MIAKKLLVYDNEGETVDRFIVVCPNGEVYTMSFDSTSPLGVNQYVGRLEDLDIKDEMLEPLTDIPDSVVLGLRARGFSAGLLFDWITGGVP